MTLLFPGTEIWCLSVIIWGEPWSIKVQMSLRIRPGLCIQQGTRSSTKTVCWWRETWYNYWCRYRCFNGWEGIWQTKNWRKGIWDVKRVRIQLFLFGLGSTVTKSCLYCIIFNGRKYCSFIFQQKCAESHFSSWHYSILTPILSTELLAIIL